MEDAKIVELYWRRSERAIRKRKQMEVQAGAIKRPPVQIFSGKIAGFLQ